MSVALALVLGVLLAAVPPVLVVVLRRRPVLASGFSQHSRLNIRVAGLLTWYLAAIPGAVYHARLGDWRTALSMPLFFGSVIAVLVVLLRVEDSVAPRLLSRLERVPPARSATVMTIAVSLLMWLLVQFGVERLFVLVCWAALLAMLAVLTWSRRGERPFW